MDFDEQHYMSFEADYTNLPAKVSVMLFKLYITADISGIIPPITISIHVSCSSILCLSELTRECAYDI